MEPEITYWSYPLKWGDTLSNHDWFPLQINRLLTSRFVAQACAEDRRGDIGTALILWSESFKQDPAGTLPDDDVQLAQIARFGADIDGWRNVREGALFGWVDAHIEDDGRGEVVRLGHRVIADIAEDMYKRKRGRDASREASRLSSLKGRVKAKIQHLGYRKSLWDSPQVVNAVAAFLDQSALTCTDDNVRMAMAEGAGVPRLVPQVGREGS